MGNTKEAVLKITQGLTAGGGSPFLQVFSTVCDNRPCRVMSHNRHLFVTAGLIVPGRDNLHIRVKSHN